MKIDKSKTEMFYEIKGLKREKQFWLLSTLAFFFIINILLLSYPEPFQEVVEKNHFNDKYLFCEYHGGVYSSHGNNECAFGEYPKDIYPEIRMKNDKWEFKNPEEVLEYFAKLGLNEQKSVRKENI